MTPIVWLARPHEVEPVARLLVDFRDANGRGWPSERSFVASVESLIGRPDTEFLLAAPDADSDAAGVCQLRFRLSVWTAAEDCWLEDLFVRPEARRRRLASALLGMGLERARARGCRRVELDTSEANAAALALYGRFGFTPHSKSEPPHRDLFLGVRLD